MLPALLLIFAVRVDPADPDLLDALSALVSADDAPAPRVGPAAPTPQPPVPRGSRARWPREEDARQNQFPPPISSLRRRPPLSRTRTGDGRLVIAHPGDGTAHRGRLLSTRRREGERRLTMHFV
ncbi:hypothetical protein QOZ80_6AG0514410 [Eleusine coracana subsp. coracana]|nr:hypothetical protein QOZ80_6AG0514410 [Eleusine coracana subsp. coracana]